MNHRIENDFQRILPRKVFYIGGAKKKDEEPLGTKEELKLEIKKRGQKHHC